MTASTSTLHAVQPLILTLTLDKSTHTFLTSLRAKYFPPSRNFLSAHLTFFHAIPAHRFQEIDDELRSICHNTSSWEILVGEAQAMGNRGVMVGISEPEGQAKRITGIHSKLLKMLKKGTKDDKDGLTNQDLMPLRHPHITVLNKAQSQEQVDTCLKEVKEVFGQHPERRRGSVIGFELWEYMGGPWKPFKAYALKGENEADVKEAEGK